MSRRCLSRAPRSAPLSPRVRSLPAVGLLDPRARAKSLYKPYYLTRPPAQDATDEDVLF